MLKNWETYLNEDEENAMDFYCIWWKRDDACRFGNKKWEIEFFIVQKMYLMGRVCVHPFSGYKWINLNMNLPWNTPILLAF